MKYEDFADHIRRMARRFAGETTHEDCPWSWEYARQKPGYVVGNWSDPYIARFKTALSVLGDQACGEIYRAEVARIRNAPSIYCHSSGEGAALCDCMGTAYTCSSCELDHCWRCDRLVNVGDPPAGVRHYELKTAVRWCWQPRCQHHKAVTHGISLERLPEHESDPVLLAMRNMAASESWRAAGCPPGEIKTPPECPWSAGGWCGRHLPKDGGCRPPERKPS